MTKKKSRNRHESYLSDEDELIFEKLHMKWCNFVHQSLVAAYHNTIRNSTDKQTVYLSNATIEPKGETVLNIHQSACPDLATQPATVHPAAPIEPARSFVEIRPDPVPAPTVLIVRKRKATVTDNIDDLLEPVRTVPRQHPIADMVTMDILKKGMVKSYAAFCDLPDRQ